MGFLQEMSKYLPQIVTNFCTCLLPFLCVVFAKTQQIEHITLVSFLRYELSNLLHFLMVTSFFFTWGNTHLFMDFEATLEMVN
jgi:hypothetical protein